MRPEPADLDDLLRRLGDVQVALVGARDDLESLAAIVPLLAPRGPAEVVLHRVRPGPDLPTDLDPVARWRPADPAPEPAQGPSEPIFADALPLHDAARSILPLRHLVRTPSGSRERWLGQLTLHWPAPHSADADERLLDAILADDLAAALAERDALAAHAHAMAGLATLLRVSERVAAASDPDAILAAVLAEVPVPDVQGKLLTIETDESGHPQTITAIAVHGGDPGLPSTLHRPVVVADSATTALWFNNPNAPVFLGDMRHHPHPGVSEGRRRSGLLAAVLIPLRWQGRWLGLIQLGWVRPRTFTADEMRLYEALAPHLAAVLDNRLLTRRCEQALADQQGQARTLEIVLDHLPVGVQIHDLRTTARRLNHAAHDLLRPHVDADDNPLPLYHPDSDQRVGPDERLSRMAARAGELVTRERDLLDPDGTRRRLSVTAAPVRDEHDQIIAAVTLFHDISARVAGERARAELRDAVVAAQRAALRERSTPLIPIDEHTLVLPLIGAIDPERGRQIVDTLAELRGHPHARLVLIDLTGVRDLDEPAARALLEAARVLRLRGARAMLTGIGCDVAWTLANLPLDLHGLAIHATLQAGLAAPR